MFSQTKSRTHIPGLGQAYRSQWAAKVLACLLVAGGVVIAPAGRTQGSNEYAVSSTGTLQADPPGRVGKISLLSGPVSLTDLQSNDVENATLNWPITSSHRLSTGRTGRAEVRIGSIAARLEDDTVVDFMRVDDEIVQIMVQRGSVALRLRNREILREVDVLTPRERIVFDDVGRYRIDVDRATGITALTAFVGQARISSGRSTFLVQSGQRGEVTAAPGASFQLVMPSPDIFDDWVLARDRRDDNSRSAQHVSRETTGVESLDEHGTWSSAPEYGPLWYPTSVPVGWAPYRYGRWVWMSPWGWTWVDDAPWGFAPFHYGRWVIVGGRWCWAPGRWSARPYYAPALVAWYGRPGVTISISTGHPVGWFPLGWGDVYYPAYYHSPRYIRSVNVQNVTTINNVTIINPPTQFAHQRHPDSVSWAPARSLPRRDRVQDVMTSRPPEELVRTAPVARSPVVVDGELRKRTLPAFGEGSLDLVRPTPPSVDSIKGGTPQLAAPGANAPAERVRATPPATSAAGKDSFGRPGIQHGVIQPSSPPTPARLEPAERVRAQPPRVMPDAAPGVVTSMPKRPEIGVPGSVPPLQSREIAQPRSQPAPQQMQLPRAPKVQAPPVVAVPEMVAPPRAPRVERSLPPPSAPQPLVERTRPPAQASERVDGSKPRVPHDAGRDELRNGNFRSKER